MLRKKSITRMVLPFVSSLLLSGSFLINNNVRKVSAIDETHDHNDYSVWNNSTSLPSNPGNYVLANDVNLSASWYATDGINLCLNGYNITFRGGNCIAIADDATVSISDCSNKQHKFSDSDSEVGLWVLDEDNGSHVVTGGCIMGLEPAPDQIDGIGVFVGSRGTFILNGGNIVGSYASSNGGGISVSGTFIMNGGSICGNKAYNGGGVRVADGGNFTMNGGTITENKSINYGAGVYIDSACTFTMNGGTISKNEGPNGSGVYNLGTFVMNDGSIVNNTSTSFGGGIYVFPSSVNILTGGEVTNNTSTYGGGVYYRGELCFAEGTPITMEDGSKKPIEDLQRGELIRVFDHNEGNVSSAKIFDVWAYPEKHSNVVNLHFSSDIELTIIYGHSFFSRDEYKYVPVTKDNVSNYVGHEFYNADKNSWETLLGYDFVDGEVDTYVITSEYHLNCLANGMLSNEDGFYTTLTNIFEYDKNLKIDEEQKNQDIKEYGIYEYENLHYASKYVYDVLNFQYLNVAFGKNLISEEQFDYIEAYYAAVDPELFCDNTQSITNKDKSPLAISKSNKDASAPTASGLYLGGSIKIYENDKGNVYLESGKTVTIGTGTGDNGNGVISPNEDMYVGITLVDGSGAFTSYGAKNYSSNFFSDNIEYKVSYNIGSEESNDEYLELSDAFAIVNNTKESDKEINHGYIEVDSNGIEDEEISVNVVPNPGYKLLSLTYNDGSDHDITSTKSFIMPGASVSISATFIEKDEQVIEIDDISKVYDGTPVSEPTYTKFGDGEVIIEYKLASEDDSSYTTTAPSDAGNYIVRVTVEEGSDHLSGSATREFVISKAKVSIPSEDTSTFIYNGEDQTYNIASSDAYRVSGNVAKEVGTYTVTVSLIDKNNYEWFDGTTDDLTFTFVIKEAISPNPKPQNNKLSGGAIAGICIGSLFLLLLIIYLVGYFFLYRKGKLDEKKIKIIYKILPRGNKNLEEEENK